MGRELHYTNIRAKKALLAVGLNFEPYFVVTRDGGGRSDGYL